MLTQTCRVSAAIRPPRDTDLLPEVDSTEPMLCTIGAVIRKEPASGNMQHECTLQDHAETSTYRKGQDGTHTADFKERLGSVSDTIEMCPEP